MTKAELRTIYKTRRQSLSSAEVTRANAQILRQFQEYLSAFTPACVHVFLPIRSQNEVDTWPIIHWLWQQNPTITVVTSVSDFKTGALTHFVLTSATRLLTNRYGISEPNPNTGTPVATSVIDMVLVPLLIFDRQGHRVGYGKGFYDRFLAECRPDCLKIGLSLFEPIECIDDVTRHDVRLSMCIADCHSYEF